MIFSVGIGEPGGAEVPRHHDGRRVGVHTDRQGNPVISLFDDRSLRRIGRTGGFFHVGRTASTLSDLPMALSRLDRSALASDQYAVYAERYQWPLGLALLLLVVASLLSAWRPVRRPVSA
jgi:Ca-activated chloride channel homolog